MITVDQILTYSPNKNYDPTLLTSVLDGVKITYVREMLGTAFYNELDTQYDNGTLTAVNETFLKDYLQPLMAYYCIYDSLAMLEAEPTSNGVIAMYENDTVPSEPSNKGYMRNFLKSRAEKLVDIAEKYLRDNSSDYPLYSCGEDITGSSFPYLYGGISEPEISKNA